MWIKTILSGLLLGTIVLVVGWGRVLLPQLIIRSLLVSLGSITALVASQKAIDVFVLTPSDGLDSNGVQEMDLSDMETEHDDLESELNDDAEIPEDDDVKQIEESAEDEGGVEDLANMVSDQMAE